MEPTPERPSEFPFAEPPPRPSGPRRGGTGLPALAAAFLLVLSAFVGFGARAGWVSDGSSSSSDSALTATVDDGTGTDAGSVAERIQDAIVNITSQTSGGVGAGTGMIITSSGLVLTNHHVISGADDLAVEVGGDGDTYDAHVVGYALDDDVALVQIEGVSGLPTIATDGDVVTSDEVLVMGNALGRGGDPTVSPGTVVALGRQITASDGDGTNVETLTGMIQIAASVQPGQSGGAVVNADGEVVGMTTAASVDGGYRFGFGDGSDEAYAIPIERALESVDEINDGESTDEVHVGPRAVLGVLIQGELTTPGGRSSGSTSGVTVSDVEDGSAADEAGITAGSTIVAIGDATVTSSDDITRAMNRLEPDDEVQVTWVDPSGARQRASVQLDEGPPL